MTYRLTEDPGSVIRIADGASIRESADNRDWIEYQKWRANPNNEPEPYVPPDLTAEEIRDAAYIAEADRADLVDRLKTATIAQANAWVDAQVGAITNLAQAKEHLARFEKALIKVLAIHIKR